MNEAYKHMNILYDDHYCLNGKNAVPRRTPIMVRIDDKHNSPLDLLKLTEAGMTVSKIDMTQTTLGERVRLLDSIHKAYLWNIDKKEVVNWPLASCVELKTCNVKTGFMSSKVIENYVMLTAGSRVTLTCDVTMYDQCDDDVVFVDNPHLTVNAKVGSEISIDQDEITLVCTDVDEESQSITCVVTQEGCLRNLVTVCIRGVKHIRPYLADADFKILDFAVNNDVDIILVNYVRHVETVKGIKKYTRNHIDNNKNYKPIIICGVCTQSCLDNIDDILKECDGIVLSREILPYELPSSQRYKLALIQKVVAAKCRAAGKPIYISGGILQRAIQYGEVLDTEIFDVANCLLDGATGFVLGDSYDLELLVKTILFLDKTCSDLEPYVVGWFEHLRYLELKSPVNASVAAALSCSLLAVEAKAKAVVLPTVSGRTAQILLAMRPTCFIIAVSPNLRTLKLLHMYQFVIPLFYNKKKKVRSWKSLVEDRIQFAITFTVGSGLLQYGDVYLALYRGAETSSFSDTTSVRNVTITETPLVRCNEDGTPYVHKSRDEN